MSAAACSHSMPSHLVDLPHQAPTRSLGGPGRFFPTARTVLIRRDMRLHVDADGLL